MVGRWEGHTRERGVWHVLGDHGANFGLCSCLLFLNVLLAHVAKRAVVLVSRANCRVSSTLAFVELRATGREREQQQGEEWNLSLSLREEYTKYTT